MILAVRLLDRVVVPVPAPMVKVVAAPPMARVVALVLNREAVSEVVVKSPPLTAMSPAVVIRPDEPVTEKLVAVMSLAPSDRAFPICSSDKSMPVVMVPASDWIRIPAGKASVVSRFSISSSWEGGVVLAPSERDRYVYPVDPAAVLMANRESVVVSARVKAMFLASVVVMVLPES